MHKAMQLLSVRANKDAATGMFHATAPCCPEGYRTPSFPSPLPAPWPRFARRRGGGGGPHAAGGPPPRPRMQTAAPLRRRWPSQCGRPTPRSRCPLQPGPTEMRLTKMVSRHCTSLPRMATQSHQDATCSRGQQGDQNGGKHHFTSLPGMAMQRSSRCSSQPTPTKMRLTEMVSRHCTPLPKRPCRGHQDAPCSRGQQRGG